MATSPILIVDDETVSWLVLAHMLRRMGHEVVDADAVTPALALCAATSFSLVMSDFAMPDGTGLDLLPALRSQPSPPPFVLITGVGERADLDDDRSHLIDDYLTKPIGSQELQSCVDRLVGAAGGD